MPGVPVSRVPCRCPHCNSPGPTQFNPVDPFTANPRNYWDSPATKQALQQARGAGVGLASRRIVPIEGADAADSPRTTALSPLSEREEAQRDDASPNISPASTSQSPLLGGRESPAPFSHAITAQRRSVSGRPPRPASRQRPESDDRGSRGEGVRRGSVRDERAEIGRSTLAEGAGTADSLVTRLFDEME